MYNSETCICKKIFNGAKKTDVSHDHAIADYFPDIKRVLNVFSSIRPTSVYINGDVVEYDGVIYCHVMYQAEDKSLQCVLIKFDYSDSMNIKNENASTADAVLSLENVSVRVLNPRKLSVKARVNGNVTAWGNECLTVKYDGLPLREDEKQAAMTQIESAQISTSQELGIGVSEDITIPPEYPPAERIITFYAIPQITQVTPQNGSILVEGNVTGILIYESTPDENGQTQITLLPVSVGISRTVEHEGVSEGCTCLAQLSVYDITTEITENAEGENRIVETDFLYDIRTTCMCNESVSVSADMYSTSHETSAEYESVVTECAKGTLCGNFTLDCGIPSEASEKISGDVLFSVGNVDTCEMTPAGKKMECKGELLVTSVWKNGDEMGSVRYNVPFKGEFDFPSDGEVMIEGGCACGEIQTRFDGENYSLLTEIYADAVVTEKKESTVLKSINVLDKAVRTSSSPFTLYYPWKNETLWDIAKKYGISAEELKKANENSANTGVMLIPKKT